MDRRAVFTLLLYFGTFSLFAQSDLITLDGKFEDWADIPFIEEASGNGDLLELAAYNDADYLYIRIKLDREIQFQESNIRLFIDGDDSPQTTDPFEDFGAEFFYHFGEKYGLFLGETIRQRHINLTVMPTYSSDEFELRIRRASKPFNKRNLFTVNTIQLKVVNRDGGQDQLPTTGMWSYTFKEGPFETFVPIDITKADPATIRLVSYNILEDRPRSSTYQSQFKRVVRALDADIFCFNEFFNSTASQVKNLMDATLDSGNQAGWYVSKEDVGNVTISRYPIKETFRISNIGKMTANLIDLPEDSPSDLMVIAFHAICCDNESQRQNQVDAIAAFIEEAKNPGGRIDLPENTPIVIAGDLNLVGFQQQLTTLLTGDIQNTQDFGTAAQPDWDNSSLTDLLPTHTEQALTTTWRSTNSYFSPGRLDFILFTDSPMEAQNAFILETTEMPEGKRNAFGLEEEDTNFSDHLPVVADFKIIDPATSVEEVFDQNFLSVFPNPTTNFLTLQQKSLSNERALILLRNQYGQLLQQIALIGESIRLDVSKYPKGWYLLEYQRGDAIESIPFLKQ